MKLEHRSRGKSGATIQPTAADRAYSLRLVDYWIAARGPSGLRDLSYQLHLHPSNVYDSKLKPSTGDRVPMRASITRTFVGRESSWIVSMISPMTGSRRLVYIWPYTSPRKPARQTSRTCSWNRAGAQQQVGDSARPAPRCQTSLTVKQCQAGDPNQDSTQHSAHRRGHVCAARSV